jgi:membrane protease YdiL (CAAX protease family)
MLNNFLSRIGTLENPPPWSTWSALSAVLAAFIAVFLCTGIILAVVGITQYTTLLLWTLAAVVAVAFVFFTRRTPEQRAALHFTRGASTPQDVFLLLFIGVGLAVALDVVSIRLTNTALPGAELLNLYFDRADGEMPILFISWVLAFALMVIVQPLADQLIFQGILLPSLRQSLGAWPGYIVTAALFGLFHLMIYSSPNGNFIFMWYGLFVPFIAGLIFGAVRLYTGSTRAAMVTHVAFGLFALVKLLTLLG